MADDEYVAAYVDEAEDHLETFNDALLALEDGAGDDALNRLFRAAHTFKSSSAAMDFDAMASLAHAMEDVFSALQEDRIAADETVFGLLYGAVDQLDEMVAAVRAEGEQPDADVDELQHKLRRVAAGEDVDAPEHTAVVEAPESFRGMEQVDVDIERLDQLMNLVGELQITGKKMQHSGDGSGEELTRLQQLSDELRYQISQARMVPVSQVFERFPRMVRDLARELDKEVEFAMTGGDLRMDRPIVEEIGEPLIHLLRNAVDHGIEPPAEREEAGKPPAGRIELRVANEQNAAVIAVSDDGAGIDPDTVRDRAVERGVVSRDAARELSDAEALDLLFHPNFSTMEETTRFSGRGVGLNVVKEAAERLQGTYSIDSTPGEGTTIEMRLPLSLAVVRSFLVRVGDQRFGVPLHSVTRCLSMSALTVKHLESQPVFIHEGEEVPLFTLADRLDIPASDRQDVVLLVDRGGERAGLAVDAVTDVQEFVSKDLDLISVPGVAGASILSDGSPVLLLDVRALL